MTYTICSKVIERGLKNGNLDTKDMLTKLDVFLLGDRITAEQYDYLVALIKDGE